MTDASSAVLSWCLSHQGAAAKTQEIASDLRLHRSTVNRALMFLARKGYIKKRRLPYGLAIEVKELPEARRCRNVYILSDICTESTVQSTSNLSSTENDLCRFTNVNLHDAGESSIRHLVSMYQKLHLEPFSKSHFPFIGGLCKRYGVDAVRTALEQMAPLKGRRLDNPRGYVARLASCQKNKERLREELQKLIGGFSNLQRGG